MIMIKDSNQNLTKKKTKSHTETLVFIILDTLQQKKLVVMKLFMM